MNEDDKKVLAKRIWGRCFMRLSRSLNRKPTKSEMEDCCKEELYREQHGLVEKRKRGRKTSTEEFFDVVKETRKEEISDEEMRRFLRRRQAKEDLKDIALLRKLNEGLAHWFDDEEQPTREESMKEASRKINEDLCSRCGYPKVFCTCQEEE